MKTGSSSNILAAAGFLALLMLPLSAGTLTDFRVRGDFSVPLDADRGWAASLNEAGTVTVDQPFRLRLQVAGEPGPDQLRFYRLQYRVGEGSWETALPADFPYPAYASPPVSVIVPPYPENQYTEDLLPHGPELEHSEDSMGTGFSPVTGGVGETGVALELEWSLVVRYFADGPVQLADGEVIAFRLADLEGDVVESRVQPVVKVHVPPRHLGGTYVETPGRIGPWQTPDGDLFFIMEPTETDNRFMVVKSGDGGRSWTEADGGNRPPARDLEAVDACLRDGILHILHYEDRVWYHAFATGEERWQTVSEPVASPADPPVQSVGLSVHPDGSLMAFHADGEDIVIRLRAPSADWEPLQRISEGVRLSGIQVMTRPCGTATLVYTRGDGKAIAREFTPEKELGPARVLSARIGTAESDVGSILSPVFIEETMQTLFVYREKDGLLYERRLDHATGSLTEPVAISPDVVSQNPVDSDQVVADIVRAGGRLVTLYGCAGSGHLVYVFAELTGPWSKPLLLHHGIEVSWVRAAVLKDGTVAYIYDAGSRGGAGMNRFGNLTLP